MSHDAPTPTKRQNHRVLMLMMCVPMLLAIGVLVALGVIGGAVVAMGLLCAVAMGTMMFAMERMEHH